MSELTNACNTSWNFRRQLLSTVSAASLLAAVYGSGESQAADGYTDRPTVWIELGGQFDRLNESQQAFSPSFMGSITQANLLEAMNVQQPPAYSLGEEAKISFQPENSDWIFSGSARYGRALANRSGHQQTKNAEVPFNFVGQSSKHKYGSFYPSSHVKFADGRAQQSESHAVLDFQAGKDVGLGMFGKDASSIVSAGVRFAQFTAKTHIGLRAEPDVRYPTAPITSLLGYVQFKYHAPPFGTAPIVFHDDAGQIDIGRNFRGIGPSLSWDASVPVAGNTESAEFSFDWGLNGAILFGRQKVRGQHQTTVKTYSKIQFQRYGGSGYGHRGRFTPTAPGAVKMNVAPIERVRSVMVPNAGGFAGISLKWSNAKISFGYRADMFFGAVDGGIDIAKSENRSFYGPFATISVGVGG